MLQIFKSQRKSQRKNPRENDDLETAILVQGYRGAAINLIDFFKNSAKKLYMQSFG
jgi:hypothetical protein